MKRRPKPLLLTLLFLPIIALVAFYFSRSQKLPSETTMLANFQQQKPILLQLIQMAKSDSLRWTNGSASECLGAIDYYDKATEQLTTRKNESFPKNANKNTGH